MTFNFSFEVAGNPFLSSLSTTTTSDLKSLSRLAPSVVVREFLVCLRGLLADKLPHRASRFSVRTSFFLISNFSHSAVTEKLTRT